MLNENEKRIDDAETARNAAEQVVTDWFQRSEVAKRSGDKSQFMTARAELEWAQEVAKQREIDFQRVMAEVGEEVKAAKEILLAQHKKAADVEVLREAILDCARAAGDFESGVRNMRRQALAIADVARSRAELARDVARDLKVTVIVPVMSDDDVAALFDTATARFADAHDPQKEEAAE